MKQQHLFFIFAIILFILLLVLKPYFDRKTCHNEALDYSLTQGLTGAKGTEEGIEAAVTRKQLYDAAYQYCLHDRGLAQ